MVLNAIIYFVSVAAALYFLIVLPMNKLREMRAKDETAPPTEIELLTEIRDALVAGKGRPTPEPSHRRRAVTSKLFAVMRWDIFAKALVVVALA